ncbi:MAG: hypothetical protein ACREEV_13895, partial [Dongiaceae bacterium]
MLEFPPCRSFLLLGVSCVRCTIAKMMNRTVKFKRNAAMHNDQGEAVTISEGGICPVPWQRLR